MVAHAMSPERLERLKKAEPAIYAAIEEMFQNGTYTKREHEIIRRLINLGNFQLRAAFSWFEYDLMRAPYEVDYLEGAAQQWEQIPLGERPAISREAVVDRLLNLKENINKKEAAVERARKEGHFWSAIPLLEYFDLPEKERAGKSFYPLLPNIMQEAYTRMQMPRKPEPRLIVRWMESIKRLTFAVSGKGVKVEIERQCPGRLTQ